MSLEYLVAAFQAKGLQPGHKMLLVALCDNADENGLVRTSRQHLQRLAGVPPRHFGAWCAELSRLGLISHHPQGVVVNLGEIRSIQDPWFDSLVRPGPENPFGGQNRAP